LGDVYYILFRQKWKIIACSVAGVLAAGAFFLVRRPVYESEAKLLIRYVMDSKSLSPASADSQIRSPDEGGNSIVNTEVEILRSFDLAQQVVDTVGPEKILPKSPEQGNRDAAAAVVSKSLLVEVPGRSSVIRVVFRHPDPGVVQPVLRELIEKYLRKHVDIHQAVGVFDDFLTRQTEELRSQLARTEQELQQARSRAGVLSLTDTKKVYTDQISKIRQELFDAQAELAEHQAILKDLTRPAPALLNAAPSNTAVVSAETPVGTAAAYKSVCGRLDLLWKKRQELLTQFTEENVLVKEVRDQIAEAESIKKKLEEQNPRLTSLQSPPLTVTGQPSGPVVDASTELARVTALESKIQVLSSQLDQLRTEAVNANASEAAIQELQRKKELEEANYRHFSASLEQSRIDEAVGEGKVSNISVIQAPSPPAKTKSKTFKLMALLVVAGVYAGLALAFVTERKLDTSVRRPIDVVTKLQLPLFLSIPRVGMNGHGRLHGAGQGEPLLLKGQEAAAPAAVSHESSAHSYRAEVAPWNGTPALHHFYEALRDRLIVDFEVRNLTHKPKLLAVTSCGRGAGVTTVASGLAACLSQTGDGNVLLVDMTQEKAAAQQFSNGRSVYGLHEALYDADRTQVQDNLFVVTERTDGDSRPRNLPRQFTQLVPKLKASNYDYIIFDMPPISQTSVTPRLASFMDQVLLVIESEKTDREVVRQANALLTGSKTSVCAVLNKTRTYVPPRLHQGFQ
jgi:succinoglycan biosynthesis transport protein ExoP